MVPGDAPAGALPHERVTFAHNAERQLAMLLDFYGIAWAYEPTTFVLERDGDGNPRSAFTPDFHLPDHDRYLEVTTLRQPLVTRKHRKLRRLRELHPEVEVKVVYQRDYLHLLVTYGLEPPQQLDGLVGRAGAPATEPVPSLLELGTVARPSRAQRRLAAPPARRAG
ncbi:MAG: hypothetical protein R2726_09320 [Acidimicrobiales bacterium]